MVTPRNGWTKSSLPCLSLNNEAVAAQIENMDNYGDMKAHLRVWAGAMVVMAAMFVFWARMSQQKQNGYLALRLPFCHRAVAPCVFFSRLSMGSAFVDPNSTARWAYLIAKLRSCETPRPRV